MLCSNLDGMTNGPNMELHDRTVAVLDALEYISTKGCSSVFAIGQRINPLQLVVAKNDQIPCEALVKHLTTAKR